MVIKNEEENKIRQSFNHKNPEKKVLQIVPGQFHTTHKNVLGPNIVNILVHIDPITFFWYSYNIHSTSDILKKMVFNVQQVDEYMV